MHRKDKYKFNACRRDEKPKLLIKAIQFKSSLLSLPLSGVFGGEAHKAVPFGPCDDSLQDAFLHTGPFLLGQCGLPLSP